MFAGKRGMEFPLWVIIELVLIGVLIVFFLTYTYDIQKDTYFQKTFVAKDLAFLLQKIQSSPGAVKFHYFHENFKTTDYDFSFNQNYLGIFEPGNHNYKIGYPLFYNTFLSNNFKGFEQPVELFIHKTPQKIEFTNRDAVVAKEIFQHCEEILTIQDSIPSQQKTIKTIVLIANDELSSVLVGGIAEQLNANNFPAKKIITTKGNVGFDVSQIDVNDDIVLEFTIEKEKPIERRELQITYGLTEGKQKGERLGCSLHNTLTTQYAFFSKGVMQSQEPLLMKNPNGASVHMGIAFSEGADVFSDVASLTSSIVGVLHAYD